MINKLKAFKNFFFKSNYQPNKIKGPFSCPICGCSNVNMNSLPIHYFRNYHKYQLIHNIFYAETTNFEHYSCGNCGASDRDRLYALYLNGYLNNDEKNIELLDIAPAQALRKFIEKSKIFPTDVLT